MVKNVNVVAYLEAGMRAAGLRQRAIANNLANVDTPGFRRSEVRFEGMLARATESGRSLDPGDVEPELYRPMTTPVDARGNDVELEMELAELLKNSGRYKTYLRVLNKLYKQMEMAIGV